jgi:hypothetical protein
MPSSTRAVVLALRLALFSGPTAILAQQPSQSLNWEIERNFRYFLYPSDEALQRVARDIYTKRNEKPPTPEQMETLLNGEPGFWSTHLSDAKELRKDWPVEWPREENATVHDLALFLRKGEDQRNAVEPLPNSDQLSRLGWASLLVRGPSAAQPFGSTDTCWNPLQRLHNNCDRKWGDYVRPPGWVVRVFDPDAPAGQTCRWKVDGAVLSEGSIPVNFAQRARYALGQKDEPPVVADCRQVRLIVPSIAPDPANPHNSPVRGGAQV